MIDTSSSVVEPAVTQNCVPLLQTNKQTSSSELISIQSIENNGYSIGHVKTLVSYQKLELEYCTHILFYEISLILGFTKCGLCMTMRHMSIRVLESAHFV